MSVELVTVGEIEVIVTVQPDPLIELIDPSPAIIIEVQTVGTQGPPGSGGSSAPSIVETTATMDVDQEDFIICKSTGPITVNLKTNGTKPVVIKNLGTATVTVNVKNGANIDYEPSFFIEPLNGFQFIPQGGQYYVAG